MKLHSLSLLTTGDPQVRSSCCLQTLISLTAMYETALVQGQPAPNAAEFNTYAFIMLLVGTRQKDALAAFFQVNYSYVSCALSAACVADAAGFAIVSEWI